MTRFHSETMSVDTSALKRVQNLGDHNFAVHSNINRREGETDSRIHLTSLSCSLLLLQVMWSPARAAKAHSLQVTTQCKQMCDSYYTVAIKSTSDWKFDFICMITKCKDDVKTMSRVLLVVRQRIITRACSSLAWWSFIVSFSSLFFFFFLLLLWFTIMALIACFFFAAGSFFPVSKNSLHQAADRHSQRRIL